MTQALNGSLAAIKIEKLKAEMSDPNSDLKSISKISVVDELIDLRDHRKHEFFSVLFTRRHPKTGFPEDRFMLCSFNISKYCGDKDAKYDPADFNLFRVVDMELINAGVPGEKAIRSINAETLKRFASGGNVFKVVREGLNLPADRI